MDSDRYVERGIAVFSNWGVFGAVAIGFLIEGISRGSYPLAMIGVAAAIAGFIGHLIVNAYFGKSFSRGEAGLGLAALVAVVLIFIISWLGGGLADTTVWIGLTLIVALVATGAIYLATRFGLKGAFSQFHGRAERVGHR